MAAGSLTALIDGTAPAEAGTVRVAGRLLVEPHAVHLFGGTLREALVVDDGVADAPILVLRDPTTAVDAVTEARMAEGIRRYRGRPGRLTVVMTTSPPLLASCDRVVFLGPDGCLTSTHAGLVTDPAYAELVLR